MNQGDKQYNISPDTFTEIKEELYGSLDPSDFHNRAESQPLLMFDETATLVDTETAGREDILPPYECEMTEKRCTEW